MIRLAITGAGAVTPLAPEPGGLLEALERGRRGLTEVASEEVFGCPCRWAGRVVGFDSRPYMPPMRARRLDRASLFAVGAARQALAGGALAEDDPEVTRGLGVILGTSSAGSGPVSTFLGELFRCSPEAAPPFEFPNTVANAPASHVSIELGLTGPDVTLCQGEVSAAHALLHGRVLLADGRCSALLVGGVDEWTPLVQLGYSQLRALRRRPEGGGGILLAEGAAAVVVEPEERAADREAPVLARVLGAGAASVPGDPYRWLADAGALERAVAGALDEAGLEPGEVGSVLLGANGVETMERTEAEVLSRLFGERGLAASGVTGAMGTRAVTGAVALVVGALARSRGRLPPYPGGALTRWPDAVRLLSTPAPFPEGATLVVSYSAGGNYAAVVLG